MTKRLGWKGVGFEEQQVGIAGRTGCADRKRLHTCQVSIHAEDLQSTVPLVALFESPAPVAAVELEKCTRHQRRSALALALKDPYVGF